MVHMSFINKCQILLLLTTLYKYNFFMYDYLKILNMHSHTLLSTTSPSIYLYRHGSDSENNRHNMLMQNIANNHNE